MNGLKRFRVNGLGDFDRCEDGRWGDEWIVTKSRKLIFMCYAIKKGELNLI